MTATDFPFTIPESFQIYIDLFDEQPEKSISKLEKHLSKRGFDAAGYFILSWLYYITGNQTEAIKHAHTAKICAPGSPFLEYLHYYISHPKLFEAAIPKNIFRDGKRRKKSYDASSILLDLESLIQKLSAVDGKKITFTSEKELDEDVDLSQSSINLDGLATETLAKIHIAQNNIEAAIKVYEALIQKEPKRKDEFLERIKELNSND